MSFHRSHDTIGVVRHRKALSVVLWCSLLLFLVMQILAAEHVSKHAIEANYDHCELCIAAHQLGSATLAPPIALPIPVLLGHVVVGSIQEAFYVRLLSGYVSRAPPLKL